MQHCAGTEGAQGGQQRCGALNDDEGNHPKAQCGEGGREGFRSLGRSGSEDWAQGPGGELLVANASVLALGALAIGRRKDGF